MSQDPNAIEEQVKAAGTGPKGLPPLDQWNPELSGDIDIRIARDGCWHYKGKTLERLALVRLFSTILRREDDGEYYLLTPVEKWRIRVDDAPLLAHTLTAAGTGKDQALHLTTNTDETFLIGKDHPLNIGTYPGSDEPRPLIRTRHGLDALLVTAAFYELTRYLVENPDGSSGSLGVWSDGIFFEIGQGA